VLTKILVFLFLLSVVLHAPTKGFAKIWDESNFSVGTPLFEYFTQRAVANILYSLGTRLDQSLGITCSERHQVKFGGIRLYQPVDFPEGAKHPVSGIWLYQFSLERCGETKIYNALAIARKDRPPRFVPMTPGTTIASPVLARDASRSVAAQAGMQSAKAGVPKGCKDLRIFDTKNVSRPRDVVQAGKTVKGFWEEVWTVLLCGVKVGIPITFWSDGKGGTFFSTKPKAN